MRKLLVAALASMAAVRAAPAAAAQRGELESKAFVDKSAGYRLKPPKGWAVVPVTPDARALGLAFQSEAVEGPAGGRFRIVVVDSAERAAQWTKDVVTEGKDPTKVKAFKSDAPDLDEQVTIADLAVRHRRWLYENVHVDTWLFEREPKRIALIATVRASDKFASSWLSAFERAAKSLAVFEPVALAAGSGTTYADQLALVGAEAERTKGWRVVATPSEKFILTTSCDNQRFVDEVIDRLERSREVFEDDYPPPPDFDHVSVVRLCASEEEFHRYGGTGGGVMGWFNPESTELVLFDAKDVDRNMSYAVMTHEAFHQYCHFLFGRSEAHRWFDEGHGDYYGGLKFSESGKAKITARMPGGLERLSGIKETIQLGKAAPLAKHLNYTHAEWQSQPPSPTGGYEQSWSIVYMLRQGMLGNVNSKVWRKEYAEILPHYIDTLRKGFEEAYGVEREKRIAEAGAAGHGTTTTVLELDSDDLGKETVQRIWSEAMKASFGQVDLAQFEEDWKLYVKKYLED